MQEAFGPVVAVYPYDHLESAIEQANATPYGLQAGIFTPDMHAHPGGAQAGSGWSDDQRHSMYRAITCPTAA